LPLKELHINRSPVIAPMETLKERAEYWGLDGQRLRSNLNQIRNGSDLTAKLHQVFGRNDLEPISDVDGQLYGGGFFSRRDKETMEQLHQLSPEALIGWQAGFEDERGPDMLFRFRARNFPETLEGEERARWEQFRVERLFHQSSQIKSLNFQQFAEQLQLAAQQVMDDPVKLQWIQDLQHYAESIYPYDQG
ncbi:MAG: exodeoxyribonuclease I, partial [Oceanobacter sp.]